MKKLIVLFQPMVLIFGILMHTNLSAQTADTSPFHVTVTGKGQPKLFIPGATCSGEVWKETVARYSKTHECHVFTLAGYAGEKAINQTPYLDAYEKGIITYIKNKKLEKVILVGHSIGGFLSLCIASKMKEHLDRVILVDALPFYAGIFNPAAKGGFNEVQAQQLLNAYNQMNYTALEASQLAVAQTLCADSTKWERIARWGAASDRKTMAYSMVEMLGHDMRQDIASIQVPVLVLAAFAPVAQYPQFTKENVLNSYRQQYQACKTCIVKVAPLSKHFIMYDAPDWFYQEMNTFIQAD
ncbi:alpha/beta fold hydrolase [Arcticibacter eurypsychrophilus]|uniref:alpha/beta fold hydrolase n=1 Tax=Arcticibacter eurypsychrophilus TaxID=1434752 RepID=UPI00084DC988|nr:alpha/beta hydrolase [Arcticibacter eurypsychrophilus]